MYKRQVQNEVYAGAKAFVKANKGRYECGGYKMCIRDRSDSWVVDALKGAGNPDRKAINLMDVLGDQVKEEEIVEGMQDEDGHTHEEEHTHDDDLEYDEHCLLYTSRCV